MELFLFTLLKTIRNVLVGFLIGLLIVLFFNEYVFAQTLDVKVATIANNVTISWTQTSNADIVCISKNSNNNWILIDCIPSYQGFHTFSTLEYVDGNYKHTVGDVYFLTEQYQGMDLGTSGPYNASYYYHLSVFTIPEKVMN